MEVGARSLKLKPWSHHLVVPELVCSVLYKMKKIPLLPTSQDYCEDQVMESIWKPLQC